MSRRSNKTCDYCQEEFWPTHRNQEYCTLCEDFLDSFSVEQEEEVEFFGPAEEEEETTNEG